MPPLLHTCSCHSEEFRSTLQVPVGACVGTGGVPWLWHTRNILQPRLYVNQCDIVRLSWGERTPDECVSSRFGVLCGAIVDGLP
jgi:hypothetical protein